MINNVQWIGLYTVIRREFVRMFRIFTQVFIPPVLTALLYFLIFGSIIGQRIGLIEGAPYSEFIAPGLIMLSVITNAYSNVSTSFFTLRFQKSVEEMLVSPMSDLFILLGFVAGGILRGVIVAVLVLTVSAFFVHIDISNLWKFFIIITLVSALFALAGFMNGMLARNFDDIMIVPTFVLSPLIYLGGMFYPVSMLPPFWQSVSHLNPFFYIVNALRQVMIGHQEVNLLLSMSVILISLGILLVVNLRFLKKGVGIRDRLF